MLVWRIEHKDTGLGPYRSPDAIDAYTIFDNPYLHSDQNVWPAGYMDLGRYAEEEEFCGFPSKEAIFNWFTKEQVKTLIQYNYRIKVYRPKEYVIGKSNKQVFFHK